MNRPLLKQIGIVSVLIASAMISGCGGDKVLPTEPVSGKVMYKGKPLVGGGTITFVPESGKAATGEIAKDGTFTLGTYQDGDGAILGEHRVEIMQNTVLQEAEYPKDAGGGGGNEEKQMEAKPTKSEIMVPQKDLISDHYSDERTTIKKTVTEGNNNFTIDVEPEPK